MQNDPRRRPLATLCRALVVAALCAASAHAQVTEVFVFNGGANNEGKKGDMFETGAQGWIFQQLGLLSASGKPPTQVGDELKQGGTTVGRVLRDAQGNVIGYENAAGTKRAYNVDTSATTLQAWNALTSPGRFVVAKHGQNGGGGVTLDGGTMYDGFDTAGAGGMGTGEGNRAGPYELPPKPNGMIHVDLNGCYTSADPPGPGGSATGSAAGIGGVTGTSGNAGVVYKGSELGLSGTQAQIDAALRKLAAAAKAAGFKTKAGAGDVETYVSSLPFPTQYATIEALLVGTGASFSLTYSKDQSCNQQPGTGSGCYYTPLEVLDFTGGTMHFGIGPLYPTVDLLVPPGALGTAQEAVQLTPTIVPTQLPRGLEPATYLVAVHDYGLDPGLSFSPPAQLVCELAPGTPVVGAFEVLPGGQVIPIPAQFTPNQAVIPIQHDGVYVVLADALGDVYCNANPNSTGQPGRLDATGSPFVAQNDVLFVASRMPPHAFGFVIVSPQQAFVPFAGGSQGNLCVGQPVGRGVGGVIFDTGVTGSSAVRANLQALPQPNGPIAVLPGNTFHFQAWHRDTFGGGTTSNFTDAVRILFM